jgi:hypothetical protein
MSIPDSDGLMMQLNASHAGPLIDIIVADSDDLMLALSDHGNAQSQLTITNRGRLDGDLQPWQRLLRRERTLDDLRAAFSRRTTFVEDHLGDMEPLFGLDLAAFRGIDPALAGESPRPSAVLLSFKTVAAPGQTIGPPRLESDESHREICLRNSSFPHIPVGLVGNFPAFTFQSRGGAAQGLEIRVSGSALEQGLVEPAAAWTRQEHPTDHRRNREWRIAPERSSQGAIFRMPDLKVPDWIQVDVDRSELRATRSLHNIRVFVDVRALKVGHGEVSAEARLLEPQSAPARSSYPVTVLPEMWRPLKGSDQPRAIWSVQQLNRAARINGFAVLSDGAGVAALRQAIDAWLSLVDHRGTYGVVPAGEQGDEASFYSPYGAPRPFTLDLGKSRQTRWNRLLADLPSVAVLDIGSQPRDTSTQAIDDLHATRASLSYLAPRPHPRLPQFAARLGHLTVSCPASPASQAIIVALMEALAGDGHVTQAYVADYDGEDSPRGTLYERAGDLRGLHAVAHGWGTRYLRAVADRLWLGPDLAALVEDRVAVERAATVRPVGNTLSIERRPDSTLRDIELCLAPLLATPADSIAFSQRILSMKPDAG